MDAIKVDIQQYKDPLVTEWNAYWTSYGCMRPIMKAVLRDFGLRHRLRPEHRFDCLVLRPQDLEEAVEQNYLMVKGGKNWCDIPLTLDPTELMRVVGMLDADQKWTDLKFENMEDMEALICFKNRFFDLERLPAYIAQYTEEFNQYANQSAAEKYLSVFHFWTHCYIPMNKDSLKPGDLAHLSPSEVQEEVCRFFSSRAQEIETKIKTAKSSKQLPHTI